MGRPLRDLLGHRFGRLVVISRAQSIPGRTGARWVVRCDCENEKIIDSANLVSGGSQSCGCIHKEGLVKRNSSHGKSRSRIHIIWKNMIQRCTNQKNNNYRRYGGRGIHVCERWHDFVNFYADMGDAPPGLTLDRIDNNKGYSKENCRWATRKIQANNRSAERSTWSTARLIKFNGRTKTLTQWARDVGLNPSTLSVRLCRGWCLRRALTTPAAKSK